MLEQIIKNHWVNKNISRIGVGIIAFSIYNWMKKHLKKEYQKEIISIQKDIDENIKKKVGIILEEVIDKIVKELSVV
jgi:hypothetical protein